MLQEHSSRTCTPPAFATSGCRKCLPSAAEDNVRFPILLAVASKGTLRHESRLTATHHAALPSSPMARTTWRSAPVACFFLSGLEKVRAYYGWRTQPVITEHIFLSEITQEINKLTTNIGLVWPRQGDEHGQKAALSEAEHSWRCIINIPVLSLSQSLAFDFLQNEIPSSSKQRVQSHPLLPLSYLRGQTKEIHSFYTSQSRQTQCRISSNLSRTVALKTAR